MMNFISILLFVINFSCSYKVFSKTRIGVGNLQIYKHSNVIGSNMQPQQYRIRPIHPIKEKDMTTKMKLKSNAFSNITNNFQLYNFVPKDIDQKNVFNYTLDSLLTTEVLDRAVIVSNLHTLGYSFATPIQKESILRLMQGGNFVLHSLTGIISSTY